MIYFFSILIIISSLILFFKILDRKLLKTVTTTNRGTKTERKLVLKLLKSKIPASTIFHDLYVENKNGNFSQIDLVVATKVGIIVFEVKKYEGWIFGNGNQRKWTQVLAYGKRKYQFYNPVLQNKKHLTDLKKQLPQFENIPFYSIVVFYGNCEFKDIDFIPDETFLVKSRRVLDVINKIIQENEPAKYTNKIEVVKTLSEAVKNGENHEITNRHIKTINDMLGKHRIFE